MGIPPILQGTSSTAPAPYAFARRNASSVTRRDSSTFAGSSLLNSAQPRSTEWIFNPTLSAAARPWAASITGAILASTPSKPASLSGRRSATVSFLAIIARPRAGGADAAPTRADAPTHAAAAPAARNSRRFIVLIMIGSPPFRSVSEGGAWHAHAHDGIVNFRPGPTDDLAERRHRPPLPTRCLSERQSRAGGVLVAACGRGGVGGAARGVAARLGG